MAEEGWARQIATDYRQADLSEADHALCEFAEKLTRTPGAMDAQDVERLRRVGFDDRAIHDAVAVVAYFNFVNRIADGLGVEFEPDLRSPEEW